MTELRIHTQIHSRYQTFDASGQLPFSIVFGLCRRSPADTDPRPILLETAGSALDVPYALAQGLLTLHQQDPENTTQWDEVDLNRLNKVTAAEAECLSLSSWVNRTEHWKDAFTIYQCNIHVDDELAAFLKPGIKYRIRLAGEDLGVKRWKYGDQKQFVDTDGKPSHDFGTAKLINSKSTAGNATFKVAKSLPKPPRIETSMRLCAASSSPDPAPPNGKLSSSTALEVSVINAGSERVTIQTRGHQRYLLPWGPFQPEPDADDDRMRIIDTSPHNPPTSGLRVVNSVTGEVVRGDQQRGSKPLTTSNADRRPKAEYLLTLNPGVPIIRQIDIAALMEGLVDGKYNIRMQSKGCRWWHGKIGTNESEDGRVPAHLCERALAPLMLESEDEVKLWISHGKIESV